MNRSNVKQQIPKTKKLKLGYFCLNNDFNKLSNLSLPIIVFVDLGVITCSYLSSSGFLEDLYIMFIYYTTCTRVKKRQQNSSDQTSCFSLDSREQCQ